MRLKKSYESPDVEIILFEYSDIVTASSPDENLPNIDDIEQGGWI